MALPVANQVGRSPHEVPCSAPGKPAQILSTSWLSAIAEPGARCEGHPARPGGGIHLLAPVGLHLAEPDGRGRGADVHGVLGHRQDAGGERLDGTIQGGFESMRMRPDFIMRAGRFGLERDLLEVLGIGGET